MHQKWRRSNAVVMSSPRKGTPTRSRSLFQSQHEFFCMRSSGPDRLRQCATFAQRVYQSCTHCASFTHLSSGDIDMTRGAGLLSWLRLTKGTDEPPMDVRFDAMHSLGDDRRAGPCARHDDDQRIGERTCAIRHGSRCRRPLSTGPAGSPPARCCISSRNNSRRDCRCSTTSSNGTSTILPGWVASPLGATSTSRRWARFYFCAFRGLDDHGVAIGGVGL